MPGLVLASASPRRAALLRGAGIEFVVDVSGVDEVLDPSVSPVENAAAVALAKARAVAARRSGDYVLAADTIVLIDGDMLGKPRGEDEAVEMLMRLSGREHEVVTGVAIVRADTGYEWACVETSRVKFREVSREQAAAYAATGEPMDKAGAYAIQGEGAKWIEGYTGSFSNIMGLPMVKTLAALSEIGAAAGQGAVPC